MQNLIFALIGACLATIIAVCSGIVFVINSSRAAGRREEKLDSAIGKLSKFEALVELVPILATRIGTLENAVSKMNSDFKHLRRSGSNPNWTGEE